MLKKLTFKYGIEGTYSDKAIKQAEAGFQGLLKAANLVKTALPLGFFMGIGNEIQQMFVKGVKESETFKKVEDNIAKMTKSFIDGVGKSLLATIKLFEEVRKEALKGATVNVAQTGTLPTEGNKTSAGFYEDLSIPYNKAVEERRALQEVLNKRVEEEKTITKQILDTQKLLDDAVNRRKTTLIEVYKTQLDTLLQLKLAATEQVKTAELARDEALAKEQTARYARDAAKNDYAGISQAQQVNAATAPFLVQQNQESNLQALYDKFIAELRKAFNGGFSVVEQKLNELNNTLTKIYLAGETAAISYMNLRYNQYDTMRTYNEDAIRTNSDMYNVFSSIEAESVLNPLKELIQQPIAPQYNGSPDIKDPTEDMLNTITKVIEPLSNPMHGYTNTKEFLALSKELNDTTQRVTEYRDTLVKNTAENESNRSIIQTLISESKARIEGYNTEIANANETLSKLTGLTAEEEEMIAQLTSTLENNKIALEKDTETLYDLQMTNSALYAANEKNITEIDNVTEALSAAALLQNLLTERQKQLLETTNVLSSAFSMASSSVDSLVSSIISFDEGNWGGGVRGITSMGSTVLGGLSGLLGNPVLGLVGMGVDLVGGIVDGVYSLIDHFSEDEDTEGTSTSTSIGSTADINETILGSTYNGDVYVTLSVDRSYVGSDPDAVLRDLANRIRSLNAIGLM